MSREREATWMAVVIVIWIASGLLWAYRVSAEPTTHVVVTEKPLILFVKGFYSVEVGTPNIYTYIPEGDYAKGAVGQLEFRCLRCTLPGGISCEGLLEATVVAYPPWVFGDLDGDYDVDLMDFAFWQNAFTGPIER